MSVSNFFLAIAVFHMLGTRHNSDNIKMRLLSNVRRQWQKKKQFNKTRISSNEYEHPVVQLTYLLIQCESVFHRKVF